jgi:hypothetical protein
MGSEKNSLGLGLLVVLLAVFVATTVGTGIVALVAGRQANQSRMENLALLAETQRLQQALQQQQPGPRPLPDLKDRPDVELKLFRHVLGYRGPSAAELAALRQDLGTIPNCWATFPIDTAGGWSRDYCRMARERPRR